MPLDPDDIKDLGSGGTPEARAAVKNWVKHLPQGEFDHDEAKVRLAALHDIRANVDEAAADLEKIMKKMSE
jgi:hypothetical protein